MKLSANFTLAELTRTSQPIRNDPDMLALVALTQLCCRVLQPLRDALGKPIRITSGYRSKALNTAIRGSSTSQHVRGEAADIKVAGLSAVDLARRIVALGLPVDQVIWYDASRGGHVHVSHTASRANRNQLLHAPDSGGYRAWKP